ncbi:DUF2560 family protein [Proteus mirabilis]|uniref:DUF2560 family protein n=1 Tax=Proteus mirabilis TaxID=584 RepID=UPI0023F70F19|nr:DUF2560 family protein [Proteus mirabilis]MDF7238004.1 DUF2560 family protein [Proteus mirabilis]
MTTITAQNQMRLELLRLVGNDTAAAQAAIEFVKDDTLKFELFKDAYKQCQTESEFVSRAQKAAREAQEALDLFTQ